VLVLWFASVLNWIWCCCISTHLTFQVSQGSVATDIKWGENFNKFLFHNSLLNIVVKKLRKSVNICQSYRKNKSGTFLWTTVYIRFNGLFSRTDWVSRHQKDKPFWILMTQKMMGGSGIRWTICKWEYHCSWKFPTSLSTPSWSLNSLQFLHSNLDFAWTVYTV